MYCTLIIYLCESDTFSFIFFIFFDTGDGLTWHKGMRFSTRDRDNDIVGYNCAQAHDGAWWYKGCTESNLNGRYLYGRETSYSKLEKIYWKPWRNFNPLKTSEMKLRPTGP